jgi:hypothetical protein
VFKKATLNSLLTLRSRRRHSKLRSVVSAYVSAVAVTNTYEASMSIRNMHVVDHKAIHIECFPMDEHLGRRKSLSEAITKSRAAL